MNPAVILSKLRAQVPKLLAVYAFGSRIQGTARVDSDLDLAVLVAGLPSRCYSGSWRASWLPGGFVGPAGRIHRNAVPDYYSGEALVGKGRAGDALRGGDSQ